MRCILAIFDQKDDFFVTIFDSNRNFCCNQIFLNFFQRAFYWSDFFTILLIIIISNLSLFTVIYGTILIQKIDQLLSCNLRTLRCPETHLTPSNSIWPHIFPYNPIWFYTTPFDPYKFMSPHLTKNDPMKPLRISYDPLWTRETP